MDRIRFAQVLDDGTFGPMRFSKEKRDHIEAIRKQTGRPPCTWIAIEVSENGSRDICNQCGREYVAKTSRLCGSCHE